MLRYEGHDVKKGPGIDPKSTDQPWTFPDGKPTDNAKFAQAIDHRIPSLVRVYEKLRPGIWSHKGLFELSSYEYTMSGPRKVFKFALKLSGGPDSGGSFAGSEEFTRAIPAWVKQSVYKRDKGQCVICGARDQLHFDHDLPFSKGGTGLTPDNVRILCSRHNLQKGAKIE